MDIYSRASNAYRNPVIRNIKGKWRPPMRIARLLSNIQPSATLALNAKTQELRAQGVNIISLAVGEPDFDTPKHVRDAAKQAIDQGFTRYTPVPGTPEVRQAIAGYFKQFYGVDAPKEATMATCGGKHALYNLFLCLLDPGDEILIPSPYWVSYPDMAALAGAKSVVVPTRASDNYLATVESLERARTSKTRVLVLNSPSNPTGGVYSADQLDAIANWAKDNDVFIVSDEVYDQLVYEPARPASLSPFWQRHPECVAVVGALSKSFAMTGWRMGFVLAHPDMIKAMTKIQSQSTSNICSVVQKAAVAALTGPWDEVASMRQAFARRRNLAMDIIATWKGVTCPKPDGAFYLFPDISARFSASVPDSSAMSRKILEKALVAAVPGVAFGEDRCIRFSYALDESTLEQALLKVGDVLAE